MFKKYLYLLVLYYGVAMGEQFESDDLQGEVDVWEKKNFIEDIGNDIFPVVDVDELSGILRKSVHLLKKNTKLELIFLIDASSSIGEENFISEVKFVQKLVADFNIGPSDARVAVIGFASTPITYANHFERDMYEKCTFLHNELPRVEYTGGNTDTIGALMAASKIFDNSRDGAAKALFLITDGFSNKGDPVPTASELKDHGITIFTFGIHTGNVAEVRQIASKPTRNYSFLLHSFSEFEALVRRGLHEDLKAGTYMVLNDTSLCDGICSKANYSTETGCCNDVSRCSCGILTGHFTCLCPPGFYGSGLMGEECLPCPKGTYNDGSSPGDILACMACPDTYHTTVKIPATSEEDCICKEGFVAIHGKCEVRTCPTLTVPLNGYFVKKNCSNVQNAACGVRCSTGYKLKGSSVRVCQLDGTWSGKPPVCVPKSCKKPKPVRDGMVSCKNEENGLETVFRYDNKGNEVENRTHMMNELKEKPPGELNYTVDTVCTFQCLPGFTMIGSKMRTCLPILQWNGLPTSCTVIQCSSLSLLKNGLIKPDNCTKEGLTHSFASECKVTCTDGYRLEGPSLRKCTGRRGTWTGKNVPNKCIDVEPPVFQCPENITIETAEEESYALVNLKLPIGTDNSGVEPIIWSKPPFLPNYPLPINIGVTKIEVYGVDGSDNGDSCDFYVEVQDNESPKIYHCESPPTYYKTLVDTEDMEVVWTEPIFMDNAITPLNIEKSHEFGVFPIGTTSVTYTATDASGNTASCTLNITVAENPCSDRPNLGNVEWHCSSESNIMTCTLSCPPGLTWTTNEDLTNKTFLCQYDRNGAIWHPDIFSNLDTIPECAAFEIPTEIVESHEIVLDGNEIQCDDLDALSKKVTNEINILVGTDDLTKVMVIATCEDDDPQNAAEESNIIPFRKKRQAKKRKFVKVHAKFIGQFSNGTSVEEVAKNLQELGQKVEDEYVKQHTFINIGNKKLKIEKTRIVNTAKLRCKPGFALKRGLCVKCPAGTFYDSLKLNCIPCPIGQYQNLEGQTHCNSCPIGQLTRRRRRKQLKDCKKICPPGTFGKIKNKQQKVALSPCTPCPIGSYQPEEGQTSCTDCPKEKTTKKKGSTAIDQCMDKIALDDPCYNFKCENNGVCFIYNGFPYCLCPEGYLGSFCEKRKNPCDSSPCYNNGECFAEGVISFSCVCPSGYEGNLCEFESNECASNPCKNGAECIDLVNTYKCECLSGFNGTNCEEDINECELFNNPCQNNGICNDLINGYTCTCRDGFTGKHCEEIPQCTSDDIVDEDCQVKVPMLIKEDSPCQGIVCPANMECTVAAGSRNLPLCTCRKGYYGKNCDEEVNFQVILTFQKRSVTEYMAVNFPSEEIMKISACLWIQTADTFNYGTLFSYAVKGNDNTFTVTDYNGFVLYVNNERVVTDIIANDGHWHFICITWDSKDGQWEIYLDGKNMGNGTGLSIKKPIPGGGRFIIGQEQDRYGGGFNEIESFVGKIAHFDIWKKVLERSEIEDMNENCRYFEGNLISWNEFLENIYGNIMISKSTFCTHCNVRELRLFRGHISIKNVGDSTFGVYECDHGFRIRLEDENIPVNNTNVWYRKCLKHGNWEPVVPRCSRISCGFPGYFLHGTIKGNSYLFSDVIEYRCDQGYKLDGNATRTCLGNGSWSGEPPICRGNVGFCGQILPPRHGSMFIQSGGKRKLYSPAIGDRAEFICDAGHRIRGSPVLTCTEEGLWDQEVPVCEEIVCHLPNKMLHYVVNLTSTDGFTVGEVVHVRCGESDITEVLVCQENGSWNSPMGLCGAKCTGKPENPDNGIFLDDPLKYTYNPGETIKVKCRYGYHLSGDNIFQCTENGTWYQREKTLCLAAECTKPFPPPNAFMTSNFSKYPNGRRVLFRCFSGYRQLGDLVTQCEDGKWANVFGRCVRTFCTIPTTAINVRIVDLIYTVGDKMKFDCLEGAKLNNNDVVCQGDGTWSDTPRCLISEHGMQHVSNL